jgi:hypothetical protein
MERLSEKGDDKMLLIKLQNEVNFLRKKQEGAKLAAKEAQRKEHLRDENSQKLLEEINLWQAGQGHSGPVRVPNSRLKRYQKHLKRRTELSLRPSLMLEWAISKESFYSMKINIFIFVSDNLIFTMEGGNNVNKSKSNFVFSKIFNFIETYSFKIHRYSKGNVTQANWNIGQDNTISCLNESLATGLEAIVILFGAKYIGCSCLRFGAH